MVAAVLMTAAFKFGIIQPAGVLSAADIEDRAQAEACSAMTKGAAVLASQGWSNFVVTPRCLVMYRGDEFSAFTQITIPDKLAGGESVAVEIPGVNFTKQ